ncbi:hypothetical protein ACHAW5_001769 [Stephanodiscus triporus]|uniref:Uncharacterized protein n=1 Tax=Stephanodiscus triporus TaxID=2934178 RepID=A0ABD3NQI5_9STRA
MGNTVISGILFQPPKPPNALTYVESADLTDVERHRNASIARTLIKNERNNITATYLWLYYSPRDDSGGWGGGVAAAAASSANDDDDDGLGVVGGGSSSCLSTDGTRFHLIPAIHITHNVPRDNDDNDDDVDVDGAPAAATSARHTLLYSHGNAEDLGLISSFLCDLARLLHVDVLCYDYSGYGVGIDPGYVRMFWGGGGGRVKVVVAGNGRRWAGGGGDGDEAASSAARIGDDDGPASSLEMEGGRARGRVVVAAGGVRNDYVDDDDDNDDDGRGYDDGGRRSRRHHRPSTTTGIPPPDALGGTLSSRQSWTPPSPSEYDCYANIHSAHSYLTCVANVPPERVILYGKSVGSGPTCWLAQRLCRSATTTNSDVDDDDDDANVGGMMCSVADNVCNLVDSREPREEDGGRRGRSSSSYGRSGAGGCDDATTAAPGGVVLHSPFLSVIRVVLDVGFTTIGDLFPNVDRVGDFT